MAEGEKEAVLYTPTCDAVQYNEANLFPLVYALRLAAMPSKVEGFLFYFFAPKFTPIYPRPVMMVCFAHGA